MKLAFASITLAMAAISACSGPTPTLTAMSPNSTITGSESEALCLAPAGGTSSVDHGLDATQSALRERPSTAPLWIDLGQLWVRKARLTGDGGFYLNVDACVEAALAFDAEDANALALRGLALMNAHRFEAAKQLAQRILERAPEHVLALGLLSDAALELGDDALALSAAQQQMAAHPGMAADTRGSYLAFLHGDSARAKELIRDALYNRSRSDPEAAAWTFVEAARLYWHVADYAGADALLVEATNWVKDYPAALALRARVALALGEPERAIGYAQRAHRDHPTIESAWLISDGYRMIGDAVAAQQWFERARRLGEQTDQLTLALMLAMRDQDPARALAAIEAERSSRGGIYVDDTYAWTLYRSGRLHEARQASDDALRLGTEDARLLFHAGAIRVALGETKPGRALIERALALNPKFDPFESDAARALLSPLPGRERGRGEGDLAAVSP